ERSARALANLSEVYRLLTIYGLADTVLLDLGGVRGFDYYSGTYFEAYVAGFGASVAAGGRYDHMLGRFGYECPAVGFAFDVGRVLAVMDAQGVEVELPGPDFFIIDFTRELEESVAYARTQRARHVLVVGSPRTGPDHLLVLDLPDGGERTLSVREV